MERFDDYNAIKNDYVEGMDEKLQAISSGSSNSHFVDLDELIVVMEHHPLFKKIPELKDRFWDMFIVDAFIGNNDRNNGNWGVIVNESTAETRIAPVFDNGSSFNNKSSDNQMLKIMSDESRFIQSVYTSRRCIFTSNDVQINPLDFIQSGSNEDCNKALLRVVPNINLDKILTFISEIPNDFNGLRVMSSVQKDFYSASLKYRYENILVSSFERLKSHTVELLISDAQERCVECSNKTKTFNIEL